MSDADEPQNEATTDIEVTEQSTDTGQPDTQTDEQSAGRADQPTPESADAGDQQLHPIDDSDQPAEQPDQGVIAEANHKDQSGVGGSGGTDDTSTGTDHTADQSDEQATEGDQQITEAEPQATDSDQPATSGTADDTQGFAGGTASPGGGGGTKGGGSGKTTKIQVIAKFLTNNSNDPLQAGSITMNVFDGEKGTLLWKVGSMDQQKVTWRIAKESNIIKSAMFSGVTGNSVKVELKVRLLVVEHEFDPNIPEVDFDKAAKFEVPAEGTLNVVVDVETTEKEFPVNAKDESSAGVAAKSMLANDEETRLSLIKSVTNVGAGKFRVVLTIPTKRILIHYPKPLE
jgi:hypothetical protein